MSLRTDHLTRCIQTLETSLIRLHYVEPGSIDYEVYRNAVVKGFELTLETAGNLLRKALKKYVANPRLVDALTYKDILRHATKHGLLETGEIERWFAYRDNRNTTAHDYGEAFAEETLTLLPGFIDDARALEQSLNRNLSNDDA